MDYASKALKTPTIPVRVRRRPDPDTWGEDEPMSLVEAVALFWPDGPLTVRSLRTAIRDGLLPIAVVAGKHLTNRRSIREMTACHTRPKTASQPSRPRPTATSSDSKTSASARLAERLRAEIVKREDEDIKQT